MRLKKRKDFLRLNAGSRKISTTTFVLLGKPCEIPEAGVRRIGFTVTRKMGCAPERNRIKRRLREAARLATNAAPTGWDYVLIARESALHCEFSVLLRDVAYAFRKIETALLQEKRPERQRNKAKGA